MKNPEELLGGSEALRNDTAEQKRIEELNKLYLETRSGNSQDVEEVDRIWEKRSINTIDETTEELEQIRQQRDLIKRLSQEK